MAFMHYLRGYWPENRWGRLMIVVFITFVVFNVVFYLLATHASVTFGSSAPEPVPVP